MALYAGLMSGTSLDGVDGVLADLAEPALDRGRTLAHVHLEMPAGLRAALLALNQPGDDELHRAALATNALMALYAQAVQALLNSAGVPAGAVRAVGAHGQTVRHRPGAFDGTGYTLQLMNGALLAERCGLTTVCDFRSADLAAGGQGAPLVPAFHAAWLSERGRDTALLNVGGIANLSLLPADGRIGGFDTGPGNVLMDLWCQRVWGEPFDAGGQRARQGQVDAGWLAQWLQEPYFNLAPPKSTGRDLFHAAWLDARLPADARDRPFDVLATLLELTARSAADALQARLPGCVRLRVCGGGAFNAQLMARIAALLPGVAVGGSDEAGIPPDQVEALAFAWLAACRMHERPANLPAVTGACGPRVLGAIHLAPASR